MKRCAFRPELVCLGDRILPSITLLLSTMLLPAELSGNYGHAEQRFADYGMATPGNVHGIICPTATGTQRYQAVNLDALPLAPAPARSVATIDFSPCGIDGKWVKGKLIVHLAAKDGTTYDQTWNIGAGTAIMTVRDMVAENLHQASWKVSTSGNAVIISGHNTVRGRVSGPSEIKVQAPDYSQEEQPAVRTMGGVKVGQKIGTPGG